jgi:hypothetical protein
MAANKLLQEYRAYIAAQKAKGTKLRKYRAPCCGGELEDIVPPRGQVWDSMMCCPYCGGSFFRVSTNTKVTTELMGHMLAKAQLVRNLEHQPLTWRSTRTKPRDGDTVLAASKDGRLWVVVYDAPSRLWYNGQSEDELPTLVQWAYINFPIIKERKHGKV